MEIADAVKVKGLVPLACKTDRIDARVLAELCWRDLVPAVWLSWARRYLDEDEQLAAGLQVDSLGRWRPGTVWGGDTLGPALGGYSVGVNLSRNAI